MGGFFDGAGTAIIAGALDTGGAALQTSANKAAQLRQNRFTERMYKNRYQYTMEDMESAGLNPILAYQQGAGNPGSGGGMTGAPNPLAGAAATARGFRKMRGEVRVLDQQKRLTKAQVSETWAREAEATWKASLNRELATKAISDQQVSQATAKNIKLNTQLGQTGLPAARAQEQLDKSAPGEALRKLNRIIRSITGRDSTGASR